MFAQSIDFDYDFNFVVHIVTVLWYEEWMFL
ncbi:MAG: Uncharacterised protein [Flavobacteriales bacterium UBA4585]|nr:MAG: Uncharacterised protein [Flavobacteriales bacterium UBA4585]